MYLTVWLSGSVHSVGMAGQSVNTSTSFAQSVGIAAVLVHNIENTPLLGDLLMHFFKRDFWHGGGNVIVLSSHGIILRDNFLGCGGRMLGGEAQITAFPTGGKRVCA